MPAICLPLNRGPPRLARPCPTGLRAVGPAVRKGCVSLGNRHLKEVENKQIVIFQEHADRMSAQQLPGMPLPWPLAVTRTGDGRAVAVHAGPMLLSAFGAGDLEMRDLTICALTEGSRFQGKTVAAAFGILPSQVPRIRSRYREHGARGLVHQMGRPPILSPARLRQARAWAGQGLTHAEIGRKLGVSRSRITELLKKHGTLPAPETLFDDTGEAARTAGQPSGVGLRAGGTAAEFQGLRDKLLGPVRIELRGGGHDGVGFAGEAEHPLHLGGGLAARAPPRYRQPRGQTGRRDGQVAGAASETVVQVDREGVAAVRQSLHLVRVCAFGGCGDDGRQEGRQEQAEQPRCHRRWLLIGSSWALC